MVKINHKGDFSKTFEFLQRPKKYDGIMRKYAERGLQALRDATPIDTGVTANSWYYKIENNNGITKISYHNSNIVNGVNIAIILEYGHATKNGGWIQGKKYINPAIQPVFDTIVEEVWKEVTK